MYLQIVLLALAPVACAWTSGPWDPYIWAPTSRTVRPVGVFSTAGTVQNPTSAYGGGTTGALLTSSDASIVLDFGYITAGYISTTFGARTQGGTVGVAFTENVAYIGPTPDTCNPSQSTRDAPLVFVPSVGASSKQTADTPHLRGGFRYLTLFANGGSGFPKGTVASASSEHAAGAQPSYAAAEAIDGNPLTWWNDNTNAAQPDVLTVVSPVPIALTGLTLLSVPDGWPTDLYVETSVDGVNSWTKHATVSGNTLVNQKIFFGQTVVARGVRVTVTAVQDNGFGAFTRIAELKPILAPWPVGTSASASSFHGPGTEPSYAPSNAIDGDTTTFWNDNDINAWPDTLTVTFPSPLSLSGVTLISVADGPPTNFYISTSPDGTSSWTTHATITGNNAVQLDIPFDQKLVAARAVRVTVTSATDLGSGAYSRIAELRPLAVAWPAGTTASGSSTAPPGGEPSYAASNAIDGNEATYWNDNTQNSWPDVLTLSFPASISISSITIVSNVNGVIKDFYVETLDTSGAWTKHATAAGNTAVQIPVWFDTAVTCVGLRITATSAQDQGFGLYTRIAEVTPGVNNAWSAQTTEITDVTLNYTPAPSVSATTLADYNGYFYCSSNTLLNQVFYAGAHTIQLCTIGGTQGRSYPGPAAPAWDNSATLTPLTASQSVLVDGAKRDRSAWSGDLGVALESAFVAGNSGAMTAVKNNLITQFNAQQASTGMFPFYGPPVWSPGSGYYSDTYSMWTMVAFYEYWLYSGDSTWINSTWTQYTAGISWMTKKIDSSGMLVVTNGDDWARVSPSGHAISANALAYRVLTGAVELSIALSKDASQASSWLTTANSLKNAVNAALWDASVGLYKDNDAAGQTLHPQDGNSLAILFELTPDVSRATLISAALTKNWNTFGAVCPEAAGIISPFASSFEVKAHFKAGNTGAGVALIERMWGYMLRTFSNSSTIEGYGTDGSLHYPNYGIADAYISHAHAWSSGPAASLVLDLVGLRPNGSVSFGAWSFAPSVFNSSLPGVQGGFRTSLGTYDATWNATGTLGAFQASIIVPSGTTGEVGFPTKLADGSVATISVDGTAIGTSNIRASRANERAGWGWVAVSGGTHQITVHS